jgi:hypothetical protein
VAGTGDLLDSNLATGLAELTRVTGGEADPATLVPAGLLAMAPVQPIRGQALAHAARAGHDAFRFGAGPRRSGSAARAC